MGFFENMWEHGPLQASIMKAADLTGATSGLPEEAKQIGARAATEDALGTAIRYWGLNDPEDLNSALGTGYQSSNLMDDYGPGWDQSLEPMQPIKPMPSRQGNWNLDKFRGGANKIKSFWEQQWDAGDAGRSSRQPMPLSRQDRLYQ